MARTGTNHLRRWEYPAESGIMIREIINRHSRRDGGLSYRVTIPARIAGTRQFKQFVSLDKAEKWAVEQDQGAKKYGQKHFLFTPVQRDDAIAALSLLTGTGMTLKQAAAIARQHCHTPAGKLTVKAAVEQMVKEKEAENLRERSTRDLKNRLDVFSITFGERDVSDIGASEVESWLSELKGVSSKSIEGLSVRSKKNYLITVRTFFNWAIGKGFRGADNPTERIAAPKIDWEAPSILTPDEALKLLTAAKSEEEGRLLPSVVLGLFAGIRSSEIMQLDWSAVDLEEKIVTIGADIAKKRRLRVIDLMPNCVAWLRTIPHRQGSVAPGKYTVRWARFVKAAGFPGWGENRSNAMRHSFGSYHFALYSDSAKTSALLGHRADDEVLFDSYRSLVRKKDAESFFGIMPTEPPRDGKAGQPSRGRSA